MSNERARRRRTEREARRASQQMREGGVATGVFKVPDCFCPLDVERAVNGLLVGFSALPAQDQRRQSEAFAAALADAVFDYAGFAEALAVSSSALNWRCVHGDVHLSALMPG